MIAAWLENGEIDVRDVPMPEATAGEALVRVAAAGICGTDLEMLAGYRDFRGIPGHEMAGTVEAGPAEWLGARVVSEINVTCPGGAEAPESCEPCRAGRTTHCARRTVLGISGRDGVFAEFVAVPVANLHRLPDTVSDEAATFVEPLAAAFRIAEQVDFEAADRVLVVGAGRLGRLTARALPRPGLSLDIATRSEPAPGAVEPGGARRLPVSSLEPGAYDVAIDCTGSVRGFDVARSALRAGGTLVLKSTYAGELTLDASSLVVDEIRVVGSRCGSFPVAIEALAEGRVEVLDLIDARFPLREARGAYAVAARPGVAKVLLVP